MVLGIFFTAFSISFYLFNIITWNAAVLASHETLAHDTILVP